MPFRSEPPELRGTDMTRAQFERAVYPDPDPSPGWMRPYYVCACGFECARDWGDPFRFERIPHRHRWEE